MGVPIVTPLARNIGEAVGGDQGGKVGQQFATGLKVAFGDQPQQPSPQQQPAAQENSREGVLWFVFGAVGGYLLGSKK